MAVKVASSLTGLRSRGLHPLAGRFAAGGLRPSLVADFAGVSGREGYAKPLPILGPELVVNGRFDDASGWTQEAAWSIVDGAASFDSSISGAGVLSSISQTVSMTDGALYRAEVTLSNAANVSGNDVLLFTPGGNRSLTSNGTFEFTFVSQAVSGTFGVRLSGINSGNETGEIDNISVREITGYRAVPCTFDELFPDYDSGDDLAVLRDSDGKLKWRAHNFLTWSEDFSNAAWSKDNGTATDPVVTPDYGIAPDGKLTADRVQLDKTGGTFSRVQQAPSKALAKYKAFVWMRTVNGGTANVGLRNFTTGVNCEVTGEWQLFSVESGLTTTPSVQVLLFDSIAGNDETADILVWGAHLHRSDLGGMVNNPDTGDSYVPTEGTPRFLARRAHHVWDGAAFVNAGLALETDAGENIAPYSEDRTQWVRTGLSDDAENLDLGNGVAGTSFTPTASAENFRIYDDTNAGWITALTAYDEPADAIVRRQSVTFTTPAGCTSARVYMSRDTAGTVYVYDVITGLTAATVYTASWFYVKTGSTLAVGGLQLNSGPTPGSYLPTNGAPVTRAPEALPIPAGVAPWHPDGVSISMSGLMTYADEDEDFNVYLARWLDTASDFIQIGVSTLTANGGQPRFGMREGGNPGHNVFGGSDYFSPGVNVPFNIASYHGPTTINGAMDGAPLTADNTVTALPDLTGYPVQVGHDLNGVISHFAMWGELIGDAGIAEASA